MAETSAEALRLTPELDGQVAKIARALNRPKSWVIEQAIKDFVAVQEWHLAAIEEGIQDADAGRVVPHDDVAAWVRSWGRPDEFASAWMPQVVWTARALRDLGSPRMKGRPPPSVKSSAP